MITNEYLGNRFEWTGRPKRVVSLLSSATETIDVIGLGPSVVGVSAFCDRYVSLDAPVVGEYTRVDYQRIAELEPDLILVTSGVQTQVGRRLVDMGLPVYTLGLPGSIGAVFDNIITVTALMDSISKGRDLVDRLRNRLAPDPVPSRSTYVEIWFGRHVRTLGGRSFISDLVHLSGGKGLYSDNALGYLKPNLAEIATMRPEVMLALSEPEYPIDFSSAIIEREWDWSPQLIVSDVVKGINIIHDGPSIVDTIEWLRGEMAN